MRTGGGVVLGSVRAVVGVGGMVAVAGVAEGISG